MEVKCLNGSLVLTRPISNKFYALKNIHLRIARTINHVRFLKRCKKHKVIPKFLFLKLPFKTKNSHKLQRNFASSLLADLLKDQKAKLAYLTKEEINLRCIVFSLVDMDQWEIMWNYICLVEDCEFNKTKSRQINKFNHLLASTYPATQVNTQPTSKVFNISKKKLSPDHIKLLEKGLNFVPTNQKFSHLNLAANIEYAYRHSEHSPILLAHQVEMACSNKTNLNHNLTPAERNALRDLQSDSSICILQADKGRSTVVMDFSDYTTKLDKIVYSPDYVKINKDPSPNIDSRLRKVVATLKKNPTTPNNLAVSLIGHNSRNPSIYGAPKIHKPNVPLRPIITFFGSVTEMAAKFVGKVLNFYLEEHPIHSNIVNSRAVLDALNSKPLPTKFIMVSFDVVNLFGSLNLQNCKCIIERIITSDQLFESRFEMPVNCFLSLVDICINTSFFEYKGEFFLQKKGVPMGSPCSPAIANLYLKDLELRLKTIPSHNLVHHWLRYIDDILAIWKGTLRQLHIFLNAINQLDQNIKFTMEVEHNDQLPFLDVLLTRENGVISFSVYNKPQDSGLVVNYHSFHHPIVFHNTVNGEIKRYLSISDHPDLDLKKLENRFVSNNYPRDLVRNCIFRQQASINRGKKQEAPHEAKPFLSLPFMGPTSRVISKHTTRHKMKLISTNNRNLSSMFSRVYKYNTSKNSNCVYKIQCKCAEFYIGETCKPLKVRISQHKYAVRTADFSNALAVHAWNSDHHIDWDSAEVLAFETNTRKRKIKEALFINNMKPSLNLNQGLTLKCTWSASFLNS